MKREQPLSLLEQQLSNKIMSLVKLGKLDILEGDFTYYLNQLLKSKPG